MRRLKKCKSLFEQWTSIWRLKTCKSLIPWWKALHNLSSGKAMWTFNIPVHKLQIADPVVGVESSTRPGGPIASNCPLLFQSTRIQFHFRSAQHTERSHHLNPLGKWTTATHLHKWSFGPQESERPIIPHFTITIRIKMLIKQ